MNRTYYLTLLLLLMIFETQAQLPILEKNFDISRKSKNGYLGGIETDLTKQTLDMIFVLKSGKKSVKREIYTFDKDLKLLNTVKDEQDIEQMRKKYKWFNFKGDSYQTNSLSASANLTGKLVFRKKQITWKYLWLTGSYNKNIKQLDKVKATSENSEKYLFRGGSYEVESDSTVLVLAGKQEKKNDLLGSMMHYDVLSCDNQINIKTVSSLDFQYPNAPVFSAALEDDNPELDNDDFPRDWILIFAPQGGAGFSKFADPKPTNYTYVRVNSKGQLVEKFNFNSPSNGWRVLGAYEREGSVFLYGSATTKDPGSKYINQVYKTTMVATTSADTDEKQTANAPKSGLGGLGGGLGALKGGLSVLNGSMDFGVTQDQIDDTMDELKYTNFQVGKISNGKFDFLSSPSIDDFDSKKAKPSDQKRYVEFDGKRFVINGISFSSSGDVFINGQDFKKITSGKNKGERSYKGVYMFQFDPAGNLKKNYGVTLDQKSKSGLFNNAPLTSDMYPSKSFIQQSADGKNLYWMMRMVSSIHEEKHTTYGYYSDMVTTTWEPLYGMQYGSINVADGQLSEFKHLGESERKNYYLFKKTDSAKMGPYTFVFSETVKGDKILISRLDLAK